MSAPPRLSDSRVAPLPDASASSPSDSMAVSFRDVTVRDPKTGKEILRGVSGSVAPSELVAIMGGSGAGKSTLLNVLSSRLPLLGSSDAAGRGGLEARGSVLYDGAEASSAAARAGTAYVMQDDVLPAFDTVEQAVTFAARTRLVRADGTPAPDVEVRERVADVLRALGLSDVAGSRIGGGLVPGLSGGQTRRVSVACEAVAGQRALFLDEITTGLDSATALDVVRAVRSLGCTALATIHSPSAKLLGLFDRVILLSSGHVAFAGTVAEAAAHFVACGAELPEHTNPADTFLRVLVDPAHAETAERVIELYAASEMELAAADTPAVASGAAGPVAAAAAAAGRLSVWREVALLARRQARTALLNPSNVAARLCIALIMAFFLASNFFQIADTQAGVVERHSVLFFSAAIITMTTLIEAVVTFSQEKSLFVREVANGRYSGVAYAAGSTLVEVPLASLAAAVQMSSLYFVSGLRGGADNFFRINLAYAFMALAASSMGAVVAAAAPRAEVGVLLTQPVFIPSMLVGGLFLTLDSVPRAFYGLRALSPIRWGWTAATDIEFRGRVFDCPAPPAACAFPTGDAVLEAYGLPSSDSDYWLAILYLFLIFAAFRLVAFALLARLARAAGKK